MPQKNVALYIHWPWCKHKCPYCDFNSHVNPIADEEQYKSAILQELKQHKKHVSNHILTSVFFGGGTPSLMSEKTVSEILNEVNNSYHIEKNTEITLEANPTSSESKKFESFANSGINRFSIGVQSLEMKDLKFLGREHSVDEALKAVEMALKMTGNVNLDLIYGLPEQDLQKWLTNLEQLLSIGTTHLSAYQLTVEKNTQLYKSVLNGLVTELDTDSQFKFYDETCQLLSNNGFNQYEVSNFSKPGFDCKHNHHVWQYQTYLGIGAGAHGRIITQNNEVIATSNYKMPNKYTEQVLELNEPQNINRQLSNQEIVEETLLMSLRLKEGVNLNELNQKLDKPWENYIEQSGYEKMIKIGFIKATKERLTLTNAGQQLLDGILSEILKLEQ